MPPEATTSNHAIALATANKVKALISEIKTNASDLRRVIRDQAPEAKWVSLLVNYRRAMDFTNTASDGASKDFRQTLATGLLAEAVLEGYRAGRYMEDEFAVPENVEWVGAKLAVPFLSQAIAVPRYGERHTGGEVKGRFFTRQLRVV